jgi:hypothetical protein
VNATEALKKLEAIRESVKIGWRESTPGCGYGEAIPPSPVSVANAILELTLILEEVIREREAERVQNGGF